MSVILKFDFIKKKKKEKKIVDALKNDFAPPGSCWSSLPIHLSYTHFPYLTHKWITPETPVDIS